MRKIDTIVIHCSATVEGKQYTAEDINKWHTAAGYNGIGYHYVVLLDGTIQQGRPISSVGAHCKGHNTNSIGVCYIGGLDAYGNAKDTRTDKQIVALRNLVASLKDRFPTITSVIGHRDTSLDLNKNGILEKSEWVKDCPCFDAKEEYKNLI